MILTILGMMKVLEIGKTAALTYARMNGPGKDEDDEILAIILLQDIRFALKYS